MRFKLGGWLMLGSSLAAMTMAWAQTPNLSIPTFLDETSSSGLAQRFDGDWEYMVGGGVAAFDCAGDAFPELFLAGGANTAKLFLNRSSRGGALKFEARASGLELSSVTGAYPINIDGDAHTDLVVLRVGENVVFRGLGDCRFERANERWGFAGGDDWSTAFSATWDVGQAQPTLAVGNYIDRSQTEFPWGTCTPNILYRPSSGGLYSATPMKPSYCALSMLFTDWNRSGRAALRVSNDREYYKGGQEQLWNFSKGTPTLFTEDDGWKRLQIWGMGIAAEDLTGDGLPEYYLTSMADQKLQTLAKDSSQPAYADIALKRGVTAHRPYVGDQTRPSTGWHAQFADVNNDGWSDLFVAKGNVADMQDFAMDDPNNLLLQQPGGAFLEVGEQARIASPKRARGAQVVDLNLDGALDLVVVNRWADAEIWRNAGVQGNWIQVRLEQPGGNRDAIGAWIELQLEDGRTLTKELTIGGGHASGGLGWVHFGLGSSRVAKMRVQYPHSATWTEWKTLEANQFYVWAKGAAPRVLTPTR
jgi:enediyne biosynthesis protein E4